MADYFYTKTKNPNLEQLHWEVENSDMTDKEIMGASWNEDIETNNFRVVFKNPLSGGDQTILNGIVDELPDEDPEA